MCDSKKALSPQHCVWGFFLRFIFEHIMVLGPLGALYSVSQLRPGTPMEAGQVGMAVCPAVGLG
jgi:hypothetical protein